MKYVLWYENSSEAYITQNREELVSILEDSFRHEETPPQIFSLGKEFKAVMTTSIRLTEVKR